MTKKKEQSRHGQITEVLAMIETEEKARLLLKHQMRVWEEIHEWERQERLAEYRAFCKRCGYEFSDKDWAKATEKGWIPVVYISIEKLLINPDFTYSENYKPGDGVPMPSYTPEVFEGKKVEVHHSMPPEWVKEWEVPREGLYRVRLLKQPFPSHKPKTLSAAANEYYLVHREHPYHQPVDLWTAVSLIYCDPKQIQDRKPSAFTSGTYPNDLSIFPGTEKHVQVCVASSDEWGNSKLMFWDWSHLDQSNMIATIFWGKSEKITA